MPTVERTFAFTDRPSTDSSWPLVGCRSLRYGYAGVWKATGPHLGLAGWTSIAAANGGIVLEPMSEDDAKSWQMEALALLVVTLGREGLDAKMEAGSMSKEEQELLLSADGATLSRVAEDSYARARQHWREGLSKLSVSNGGAGGSVAGVDAEAATSIQAADIPAGVLGALRQQARHQTEQSSLIRTDLKGPATFGAMAAAVAKCAAAPGQTSSTTEMLRKLAATLAQLDASKAAEGVALGDEV